MLRIALAVIAGLAGAAQGSAATWTFRTLAVHPPYDNPTMEGPLTYASGYDAAGRMIFLLREPGEEYGSGYAVQEAGEMRTIVRNGAAVAGVEGSRIIRVGTPRLAPDGSYVFHGAMDGPGLSARNGRGIFRVKDGVVEALVRSGDRPPGARRAFLDFSSVSVTDAGDVVFLGQPRNEVLIPGAADLYRLDRDGKLEVVVSRRDVAPDTGGMTYSYFYEPSINGAGDIVFSAHLRDETLGLYASTGVFRVTGSGVEKIVGHREIAPGTGGRPFGMIAPVEINDRGDVAFLGPLIGAGVRDYEIGIFAIREGVLSSVLTSLDRPPGAGGLHTESLCCVVALNDAGDIAFNAALAAPGASYPGYNAIYVAGRDGVELVLRAGSLYEIAAGDRREVAFAYTGADGFADDGRLLLSVAFRDGGSAFVEATRVDAPAPVPLPPAAALLVGGFAGLGLAARRRRSPSRRHPG